MEFSLSIEILRTGDNFSGSRAGYIELVSVYSLVMTFGGSEIDFVTLPREAFAVMANA